MFKLRVARYIDMTDIAYCLAPRYIVSRKFIRYRHIETVSFLSLCVWFYDRIGSQYIITCIMRCSRSIFSKRFTHAYVCMLNHYISIRYFKTSWDTQNTRQENVVYSCRYGMTGVFMWQIWLMNSPWFKILHTEGTYYFYSGHGERGNIPNLQLFSCVERAPSNTQTHGVHYSFVGSFAENDCRFVFNKYEFLSIYRQTNGRYIDMTTHLDMPPLV